MKLPGLGQRFQRGLDELLVALRINPSREHIPLQEVRLPQLLVILRGHRVLRDNLQRCGVLLGSVEALVVRMLLLGLVVFPSVRLDQVRQHLGEAQAQLRVSRLVASLKLLAHFLDDAGEFIGAGVAQQGHSVLHSRVELGGLCVQAFSDGFMDKTKAKEEKKDFDIFEYAGLK